MFVFRQAPAGFAQVEKPYLNCTAVSNLNAGSSFVNIADVGGVYNGTWVQAISRWVTKVYGNPFLCPVPAIDLYIVDLLSGAGPRYFCNIH